MSRLLNDWLASYLEFTSLSESPELFHFWTGVSVIAGALKRRVWIDQTYFEWTPNFYILLVAPAGIVSKSTSIGIGKNLLTEVDGVVFGPDSGTWQAIGQSLEEAKELVSTEPGNFNAEMEEMSCITCTPGEFGTFMDFSDSKLVDVLTSLWDGQRGIFEHRTKTQGSIVIHNPWVNIISATTPAWLKANFPETAIGGGFASRCIFVFANAKRKFIAYPGQQTEEVKRLAHIKRSLIHDLQDIAQMFGPMSLTPDAVAWGESWYEDHWENRPIHLASDRFDGYRARKQTHIHKLAIIISAAESNERVITLEHLQKAEQITSGMEVDMLNVFSSVGVTPMYQLLYTIVSFLSVYKDQGMETCPEDVLLRHCYKFMSDKEFQEASAAGIKARYLYTKQVGSTITWGVKIKPEEIGK